MPLRETSPLVRAVRSVLRHLDVEQHRTFRSKTDVAQICYDLRWRRYAFIVRNGDAEVICDYFDFHYPFSPR
jgi:hypothetical protein